MIVELRLLRKSTTTTEPDRLQYRCVETKYEVDRGSVGKSEWIDVPVVIEGPFNNSINFQEYHPQPLIKREQV